MARRSRHSLRARLAVAFALLLGAGEAAAQSVAATVPALAPALLDATVNGQASDGPIQFQRDAEGRLFIGGETLRRWRIRPPQAQAIMIDGETYFPATALDGLRLAIDEGRQSVTIDADPAAFELQRETLDDDDLIPMTPPGTGLFLNYDLLVEHVRGETSAAGAFEAGLFTPRGTLLNSFIASAGGDRTQLTRLETTWTLDRPHSMTSIRIGDSISAAGPGAAPVRFAGIQFARNFAVRPGFLTLPLPAVGGSAAVPSVVDLYVNGTLQTQRQVAPGPFELSNVPAPSGGGTVQIVVRDLLGREIITEQAYYSSAGLLRRGLHDFSYEAGLLRKDFGRRSNRYGSFFASTAHRYGVSDHVTVEATAQASRSLQMAGVALTSIMFDLAQIGGSIAVSRSPRGTGFRAAASLERRSTGFSFGLLADYASPAFTTLGLDPAKPLPRYTLQAFADLPWSRGGIGINLLHRSPRDAPDETLVGVFASWRISDRFQLQAYARHTIVGERRTSFGAHLSVALGGRRSAWASVDGSRRERAATVSYQDDPPAALGGGYRVTARAGAGGGAEATYTHNLAAASLTAQLSHARGATGARLSAAGSIGFIDSRLFASRRIGESFAAVRVPGFAGVRVYADNQPVGRTDASGFIVVPGLRPFERNAIRIEQGDLPIDATLEREEIALRPFARAGAATRFAVSRERGVLLRIRLANGAPLPAGAVVRAERGAQAYVAVSGGEVYAPGLAGHQRLEARWPSGRCGFTVLVPGGDDPQPRVDNIICGSDSYVAR